MKKLIKIIMKFFYKRSVAALLLILIFSTILMCNTNSFVFDLIYFICYLIVYITLYTKYKKIDEAINYIKDTTYYDINNNYCRAYIHPIECDELLNILEGSNDK